jgi:ATP-binding cassette subfamily B protein RaxB
MLGAPIDLALLRRKHPVSSRGLSLRDLIEIASSIGLAGRAVKCELEELRQLQRPSILHWGLNHFVVLQKVTSRGVRILDPATGRRHVSLKEASNCFTGVGLELSRSPAFRKRHERSPLKLSSLFRLTPGLSGGLAQTLILSLLLQAYVVASPFYMQLAIDEAALKGDSGLLVALAVGFGLFALFNAGAEALRGVALQRVSALVGWDMTQRLYRHMIRLPLPWFQRRRLADALTRFEALEPIRQLIANGLVASVVDGLLALVTVVMMAVFAPLLTVVVVLGLAVYIVIRTAGLPLTVRLGAEAFNASVSEQGKRIETLRAMQTIKVMGAETEREANWANKYADVVRKDQSSAHANIAFRGLQSVADAVTNVVVIYLGARAVMDGMMTVGVLYAFMAYRGQFLARATNLFETLVNWRMLDIYTYRIADIVLSPVERGIDKSLVGLPEMKGGIRLENVAFAYAPHEPAVFRNVNLRIDPGEFVALVGPSGSGKSTLLKVVCGLYPPSHGEVRFDGLPLAAWGPRGARRRLGVVMQDDELLSGSIAENVAFFDEEIDIARVWECLRMAAMVEEVQAMPMRAETFVGDMGSALSGGQKQRILLARALYRRPAILVLDEATSHLDVPRERAINEALRQLSITRLVVAHRPETIAAADRVLVLEAGSITLDERRPLQQ